MSRSRGQAFTVEAILASLVIIGTLVIISQTAAVAPLQSEAQSQTAQEETTTLSSDLLETSAELETLHEAILQWDPNQRTFDGAKEGRDHYQTPPTDVRFGEAITEVFTSRGYLVNIDLVWTTPHGTETQRYLHMGTPDENAVTMSHTVTLMTDDTVSYTREGTSRSTTLQDVTESESAEFFAQPSSRGRSTYQSVNVRMTVWGLT